MSLLNTAPLQQGIANLGQALARNNQILAEQQTAKARLGVRQKLNDKMNEMTKRQEFSGDWGQELRDFQIQSVTEVSGDIKDPNVLAAFENEMANEAESRVPAFQKIQTERQTEQIHSNLETSNDQGIQQAADDPQTFLTTVHGNLFDPKTGKFTQASLQAYGGPDGARRRTQEVVDSGANNYVQAQLDKILNDPKMSWIDKSEQLQVGGHNLLSVFDFYGLPPSAATKAKLDDAVSRASAQAQTAAVKEHKEAGLSQLAQTVSAMQFLWTQAKIGGQGFDPTSGLKSMLLDEGLDTDVREAVNTTIKELTLEADKSLSTEKTAKALSMNLDNIKNRIQVLLGQGANQDFIDAKIVEWIKAGPGVGLDPRNYSEAVAFAKGGVTLEADPLIKGVILEAFKDLPDSTKNRMAVRFKELAGGLYNHGDPDAFKNNGRWDIGKLKAAAGDMVTAEKEDILKKILTQDFNISTASYGELVTYVDRATAGKLIGQVDPSNVVEKAAKFTDGLWADLKARGDTPKETPRVEFNMYTSAGLPTFVFANGTRAYPVKKGEKIDWVIQHVAPAPGKSAPNPNQKPY